MIRAILPIAIFSVLAGFLYVGLYKDPSLVPSPLIGKPIPSFQLSTLKDADAIITQENFKGEIALINVWGTWCVACKQEHAALVYIADKKNIPIYGLNYKDDREMAKQWLVDYGDPYVMSAFDASGRIAIDFGVYGAPETFLIDDKGIIRHKLVGIMTADVWEQQFVPKIKLIQQGQ
jgi:cytochrome c biogenesis protein CcmG/thiol:disulfide interchange protein DsbE